MAISYPIPSGLNDTWDAAKKKLQELIGNALDPNKNAQPPNIQGMDIGPMPGPPKGIPGMIAGGWTDPAMSDLLRLMKIALSERKDIP